MTLRQNGPKMDVMIAKSSPVVLSAMDTDCDVETIALEIAKQQKAQVGTTYNYCTFPGCLLAVSKSTSKRCKKTGAAPRCASHRVVHQSKDLRVFLCSVCRDVLRGKALYSARHASAGGAQRSCGKPECQRELRRKASRLPCNVCGQESTVDSSVATRSGMNRAAYCNSTVCRKYAQLKKGGRGLKKGGTSEYHGVFWNRAECVWRALICYRGITVGAGRFDTEMEAAKAYDIAACDILGRDAKLNFGEPGYV